MIQKHKKQTHSPNTWVITILLSAVVLYGASLFTPFLNGYAWFPIAHLQCGAQPYIASNFSASRSYTVPGDGLYDGPNVFTTPNDYYCSRAEVEEAQYRPYEWGERCRTNSTTSQIHCASGGNGYTGLVPYFAILAIGSVGLAFTIFKFSHSTTMTRIKKLFKGRR